MTHAAVLESLGFDADELESIAQQEDIRRRRLWRLRNAFSGSYLFLNATSTRVPGPASYLGLAPHVQLLHHTALWGAAALAAMS